MNVINIPIDDIKPYDRNAKKHDEKQVKNVAQSIKEFGFVQPVVIGDNNEIIIGHCRFQAAKRLKMAEIPVVKLSDLSEDEANKLRLLDNKLNESEWDLDLLLEDIPELDFSEFDIDWDLPSLKDDDIDDDDEDFDDRDPSCQHNVFENQEIMQFPGVGKYEIPEMFPTNTTGDKFLRFMDYKTINDPENYIAHFYYDDYKFIQAWRNPDKYVKMLREFKAVVSPDFSLYTDFPVALQILSCYRRQWCGAYWQSLGIDVIPDVVWGEKKSYDFCFDGIPKHSTVAVSTVGVANDKNWNNGIGTLFKDGYNEMMNRLEPTTILWYGAMNEELEGNIIRIPSYYEERRKELSDGQRIK